MAVEQLSTTRTLPRGPKGHFLLGNLQAFKRDPLAFLSNCAHSDQAIIPIRLLHLSPYLLNDPHLIEEILVTHNQQFVKSRFYQIVSSLLGQGLILNEGESWLRQRRLMQPAFHRHRIAAYGEVMVDYSERLMACWENGQVCDMHQEMMRVTLEIAGKTLFDADATDDVDGVGTALSLILKEASVRFSNPIPIPEAIPTPANIRYRRAIKQLDKVIYRIIDERRATNTDKGDLLSMLLHAQDEDNNRMTDQQLRDESLTLFTAGHETTALALTWMWYLLSEHPEVESKLTAELNEVLGGRRPTAADLSQLPYTDMVLKETLRLYPIVPLLGRESCHEFELDGYQFPAGTEFWIVPWMLQRSPHYYDEPNAFKPERWAGDLANRLPRFAYFPFGGGPRLCIGNNFAIMEAKLILATIIQNYQIKLVPDHPVEAEFTMTIRAKNGMKMRVTKRK